jgi:hypothetical protein
MKKLLIPLIIAFGVSAISYSQQYGWKDISANMPEQGGLSDVHFIGAEGWITEGNDKMFFTSDDGESFQIQELMKILE